MDRRGFLRGILAAGVAPAFVRSESLMRLVVPRSAIATFAGLPDTGHLIRISSFGEELAEITRRAFIPRMVVQVYRGSPLLSAMLSNAMAKKTTVLTAPELRDAALAALKGKPGLRLMHPAAFEWEWEPGHANPDLRVRVRVVLFETAKAAHEYMMGNKRAKDAAPASAEAKPAGEKQGESNG